MSTAPRPGPAHAATFLEAAVVVALCFGISGWLSFAAIPWGGASADAAFLRTVLIEGLLAAVALVYLHRRGHSLSELLPQPDCKGSLAGAALCAACLLAWWAVSPWLPALPASALPAAMAAAPPSAALVVLAAGVNGLYEETFLLGYLVRGFSSLGAGTAVGCSLLVRMLYHSPQGATPVLAVGVFGLVAGAFYWRTRALWAVAVAHVLQDLYSLAYVA